MVDLNKCFFFRKVCLVNLQRVKRKEAVLIEQKLSVQIPFTDMILLFSYFLCHKKFWNTVIIVNSKQINNSGSARYLNRYYFYSLLTICQMQFLAQGLQCLLMIQSAIRS